MNFHRQIACCIAFFCVWSAAQANNVQTLDQQAVQFLDRYAATMAANNFRVEYEIGNIDPRLNTRHCAHDINFAFRQDPLNNAQTTLEVRCDSEQPWRMYITSEVKIFGQALAAEQPIPRGSVIGGDQVTLIDTQVNQQRADILTQAEHAIGMIAKRSIPVGQLLNSRVLRAPELVGRGDEVVIVAQSDSVAIRTTGTALNSGSRGQQISVRNNRSERVIRARVVERGRVVITL